MSFTPFDPLAFKSTNVTEAALAALKREIENILSSYVGWYDPFCELIQNALDAVEARYAQEHATGLSSNYEPKVEVFIDLDENLLSVTDNGIGLDKDRFEQFLAPNFSFKTGNTRGHKGVGATYVAYGFNYMRVSTKTPGFEASGRIVGARDWLKSHAAGGNPKVEPDNSKHVDSAFEKNDRGVSVVVRFDQSTHPKRLDWLQADSADKWSKILAIKTGIGSVTKDDRVKIAIKVRAKGKETTATLTGTSYLWLHNSAPKIATFREIIEEADKLYKKYGANRKLPDKYNNLDFIYDSWTPEELKALRDSRAVRAKGPGIRIAATAATAYPTPGIHLFLGESSYSQFLGRCGPSSCHGLGSKYPSSSSFIWSISA